jgi:hypothetical protein
MGDQGAIKTPPSPIKDNDGNIIIDGKEGMTHFQSILGNNQ